MTGREAPTAELSGTAGYLARWRPSSVTPQAACFARQVVAAVAPPGRERAKNLLWAAGRLADWAIGPGLEPVPQVLLHPSVIERFAAHEPAAHRPARCPAAAPGGPAAAPRAGEGALQPGGDRRLPGPRRCAADRGAADAGGRAGLPGRRRRADPRRPARRPRR